VAARYGADGRVRELASEVVPVAGLIAETGATLREAQFGWLREVAVLPEERRGSLLQSVDRFRDPELNPLGEEIREELLERLGMFGLRLAVGLLADGQVRSSTALSQALLEQSGIRDLQRVLTERYAARAQALKARSALTAFRAIGTELDRQAIEGSGDLVLAVDRLEASSQDLALLRLLHLVLTDAVTLAPAQRTEIDRLCTAGAPTERVGLEPGASAADVRVAALAGVERWRSLAVNPMSDRRTIEAAEIVSRAYEDLYTTAV
jgi:hypothetical protein